MRLQSHRTTLDRTLIIEFASCDFDPCLRLTALAARIPSSAARRSISPALRWARQAGRNQVADGLADGRKTVRRALFHAGVDRRSLRQEHRKHGPRRPVFLSTHVPTHVLTGALDRVARRRGIGAKAPPPPQRQPAPKGPQRCRSWPAPQRPPCRADADKMAFGRSCAGSRSILISDTDILLSD